MNPFDDSNNSDEWILRIAAPDLPADDFEKRVRGPKLPCEIFTDNGNGRLVGCIKKTASQQDTADGGKITRRCVEDSSNRSRQQQSLLRHLQRVRWIIDAVRHAGVAIGRQVTDRA